MDEFGSCAYKKWWFSLAPLLDYVTLPEDNAQNFHLTAIEVDLGTRLAVDLRWSPSRSPKNFPQLDMMIVVKLVES